MDGVYYEDITQLVEYETFNFGGMGSSPIEVTQIAFTHYDVVKSQSCRIRVIG